ncbi:hypothetical protein EDC96DRAFT_498681 [Choanephora cucurbitarum]|nr:hypothetical protein EDC96DRAFT_498681 [Choanephora cucurbitarum]
MALQMVYLRRMADTIDPADFLTPWLLRFFQLTTGHASFLPALLCPNMFKPFFKNCPSMQQLLRLIINLPRPQISSAWPVSWLLDIPLSLVLLHHPPFALPPPVIRNYFLVSDLLCFNESSASLTAARAFIRPTKRSLLQLFDTIFLTDNHCHSACSLHPAVSRLCQFTPPSTTVPIASPFPLSLSSPLPPLENWIIHSDGRSLFPVLAAPLKVLRLWWAAKHSVVHRHVPFRIQYPLLLPQKWWKVFWKLPLPQSAFTPWWRLIHASIANGAKLYHWKIPRTTTALCPICQLYDESLFHFFVSCPYKWAYWVHILEISQLASQFPTSLSLWTALVSFADSHFCLLPDSTLVILGKGLSALWRYHYTCVFDQAHWYPDAPVQLFLSTSG